MIERDYDIIKSNGKRIAAHAYIPDGENQKYPTVIFAHGFNGTYTDLMHHGNGYAENGIVCIFFDFYGGGVNTKSDGKLNEMTVLTEANDLEEVIEYVRNLDYVDKENLFLQGESQGGFVSAYVAAHNRDLVKGLVLWYPAFVIPDDSKRRFEANDNSCFGLELSPDFNKDSMDIDIMKEIVGYDGPTILIHGDKDEIVPIDYSYKADAVYADSRLVIVPGAGHGFDGDDSVFARETSIEFIKEIL